MCERTYCRHEHERLCSCPPVTCRDALGMAAHLAENMEQVQWSLTYNSLKDIKPYQLCLVGKCRICGGRLCMEQRPVEADSTDHNLHHWRTDTPSLSSSPKITRTHTC